MVCPFPVEHSTKVRGMIGEGLSDRVAEELTNCSQTDEQFVKVGAPTARRGDLANVGRREEGGEASNAGDAARRGLAAMCRAARACLAREPLEQRGRSQ